MSAAQDQPRLEEFEGRLAEVEHAVPHILTRPDRAGLYLKRELQSHLAVASEQAERWAAVVGRTKDLVSRLAAGQADDAPEG